MLIHLSLESLSRQTTAAASPLPFSHKYTQQARRERLIKIYSPKVPDFKSLARNEAKNRNKIPAEAYLVQKTRKLLARELGEWRS